MPPVRGHRKIWAASLGVYGASAVAVAGGAGVLLAVLGQLLEPSFAVLAVVALAVAPIAAGLARIRLPWSRWRVPRGWSSYGRLPFAATFGGALGAGMATALPSPGFYALLTAGLTVASRPDVALIFGTFGLARALPVVLVGIAAGAGKDPIELTERARKLVARVGLAEATVLTAIGGVALALSVG